MSRKHWSEYWSTGVLTSLPSDFKVNYDGELFDFWESVLVADVNTKRILDVCTGNGAVAILLSSIAEKHKKEIEIVAIDASDINPNMVIKVYPEQENQIKKIKFFDNCLVEDMAQSIKGKFDLIVSQYGIEYCDTKKSASNIADLLRPNGRFVFVAHSPNTVILDYMRIEQQIFEFLESVNIFEIFSQFSNDKLSANSFKNKLETILQQMNQQHHYKTQKLFKVWGQTIYKLYQMRNIDLKQQRKKVEEFSRLHLYAMKRAEDMLLVSEKLINDKNWYHPFEQEGLILENHGELKYQGKHNVGHFYEFKKPELIV